MRTSAEVEAEVEASRDDLDRNVEALKQKMTPGQLFDEAARMMGGTGQQVGARFAEQAKANPMPLAVMGLGLAWLMMSNNRAAAGHASGYIGEPRSFSATPFEEASSHGSAGVGAELRDKAHVAGEKAHDMIAGVQDRVAGARSAAAHAGEGLSSMAASTRDKASQAGREAQRTFLDALESEPLLIAGLGLVVGAAIGAALPATRTESQMMGETRDRMLERGKELAQAGMEKAGVAAQATYGAVKAELSSDDGRPLEERLGDAARSGVEAGQEQLQGPPH
ncbi:DUF3618 domain-containing protein [Phenylobacterium sp. LjRoot219]|uniref:DUF3618 domain-containing protein n=1 Tax=Phenylobacterium sp. LjRoot219 TaxID=3342283 RepID=UPI003ECD7A11